MLQSDLTSNWTTTVLLNVAVLLFGVDHAEQVLATLSIILGFFSFGYFSSALNPQTTPWTPIGNFLLNTWFLWIGFYNFYLGMAVCMLVAGFYVRYAHAMTLVRIAGLAAALVDVFFTHALAAGIAIMAVSVLVIWIYLVAPLAIAPARPPILTTLKNAWRPIALAGVSVAPAIVLLLVFVHQAEPGAAYDPQVEWAWNSFPMHVFASSRGRIGEQLLLYPAMLFFIAIATLAMRRREWASAQGAVVIIAILSFGLYLLLPNAGFGGDEIKMRLAWAVFVFGGILANSVSRMRPLRTPLSIYVACFMVANLIHTMEHNVWNASDAVYAYASALDRIPSGATIVRLRYPTEKTRERFGFSQVALDPFFHVDALIAARRRLVDLSDYQVLTRTFPVVFRPTIQDWQRYKLWDLEGSPSDGAAALKPLLATFPVPIDYVVVVGDDTLALVSELKASMELIATDRVGPFVYVFKRR
jgi:hypothetical protein